MGDTGSLTLGYILSFLAIKYSQNNPNVVPYTQGALIIAFSALIIPVFDVVRVVIYRLRNGKNPFEPDKNHIHHKFLAMGFTQRAALISIQLMSICFCAFTMVAVYFNINNTLILTIDIVVWTLLHLWFDRLIRHKRSRT